MGSSRLAAPAVFALAPFFGGILREDESSSEKQKTCRGQNLRLYSKPPIHLRTGPGLTTAYSSSTATTVCLEITEFSVTGLKGLPDIVDIYLKVGDPSKLRTRTYLHENEALRDIHCGPGILDGRGGR